MQFQYVNDSVLDVVNVNNTSLLVVLKPAVVFHFYNIL